MQYHGPRRVQNMRQSPDKVADRRGVPDRLGHAMDQRPALDWHGCRPVATSRSTLCRLFGEQTVNIDAN
jgi:hypothetical protein